MSFTPFTILSHALPSGQSMVLKAITENAVTVFVEVDGVLKPTKVFHIHYTGVEVTNPTNEAPADFVDGDEAQVMWILYHFLFSAGVRAVDMFGQKIYLSSEIATNSYIVRFGDQLKFFASPFTDDQVINFSRLFKTVRYGLKQNEFAVPQERAVLMAGVTKVCDLFTLETRSRDDEAFWNATKDLTDFVRALRNTETV